MPDYDTAKPRDPITNWFIAIGVLVSIMAFYFAFIKEPDPLNGLPPCPPTMMGPDGKPAVEWTTELALKNHCNPF
jgi:hypothetical protein